MVFFLFAEVRGICKLTAHVKIFIENPCDKSERFDTINLLMPEFQIAKT